MSGQGHTTKCKRPLEDVMVTDSGATLKDVREFWPFLGPLPGHPFELPESWTPKTPKTPKRS